MCGIVGYIGTQEACPILLQGLRRLEYRGYDSAGIALVGSPIEVLRRAGKVGELSSLIGEDFPHASVGIGHTRWATHGAPTDLNAHPHLSGDRTIALVHNGIIENYLELKHELEAKGHHFESDTDTEVIVHLVEEKRRETGGNLREAVRLALRELRGAYAIGVVSSNAPDELIAARMKSPLAIGIGDDGYFIASDATPLVEHTRKVVYLEDGEVVTLPARGALTVTNLEGVVRQPQFELLTLTVEALQKLGHPHYMHKEIFEQPDTVRAAMRGRFDLVAGYPTFEELGEYGTALTSAGRIVFVACGTSWHAAQVAARLFEEFARTPAIVEYASEFRYRNPVFQKDDVVIAVSQSGETADTLAAIELAKDKGATVIGITNVVGSSVARTVHANAYLRAGPEISVASTKAFTAQVMVLTLMALWVGIRKGTIAPRHLSSLLADVDAVPQHIEQILKDDDKIRRIAEKWSDAPHALFLGRGYNMAVALEGALKLKEISYIPAEGYPAGEMKHGPIALIEPGVPTFVLATRTDQLEKVLSNIEEVRARGGPIIAIATEGDASIRKHSDDVITVPYVAEPFQPILTVIPLQLLAYHAAVARGTDVDQPRNLAKSVTVE